MTREELKEHCERQIENCEMWASYNGVKPHGKVYEEHKLILNLLEQEPILDKIRAEIKELDNKVCQQFLIEDVDKEVHHAYQECLNIIDKNKLESEDKYQKIQDKLDQLEHEMELTLESDPRTMTNRESEDGWLFDKIIRWRKIISEVDK